MQNRPRSSIGREGVVGLSRAFMYAGTDTVLVSLWSVADESTYKLMVKFFEGLKAGKDKLTALKDAKITFAITGMPIRFTGRLL